MSTTPEHQENPQILTLSIDAADAGSRLDVFLAAHMEGCTRSEASRLIAEGLVRGSSGKLKAGTKVKAGEQYEITLPQPKALEAIPQDIPLDILYEDADVIVVNKPRGMVVHPAPGHEDGTLVNAVLYHCSGSLSGIGGVMRPGIVHRIDRDTTGSVMICKNDLAHQSLAQQLAEHSCRRIYRAIVCGRLPYEEGVLIGAIGRDKRDRQKMAVYGELIHKACPFEEQLLRRVEEDDLEDAEDPELLETLQDYETPAHAKSAVTHYRVLERFDDMNYTMVACRLETGRTHQIRVHMNAIHHPILGDPVYGLGFGTPAKAGGSFRLPDGQLLHAEILGFQHPSTGIYVETSAELPEDFQKILKILA